MSDARRLAEGYAAWFKAVELGAAVRGDVIDSLARELKPEKIVITPQVVAALRDGINVLADGITLVPHESLRTGETAEHWIGPFEWKGGECPLPPETLCRFHYRDGNVVEAPARRCHWDAPRSEGWSVVTFSYQADNPKGWIERPHGWAPPEDAYPMAVKGALSASIGLELLSPPGDREWFSDVRITHIRLLPRKALQRGTE